MSEIKPNFSKNHLKSESRSFRGWLWCGTVVLFCLMIESSGESGRELLRYQSDLVEQKEYWRFLTGHFAHLSWSHFALNGAALLLICGIYGHVFKPVIWVVTFVFICLGTSAGFLLFDPTLDWYVGLSGALHGLLSTALMYLLICRMYSAENVFKIEDSIVLIGLIAKLLYEQILGPVPLTESGSGGPVVVNAHFYGAILGCVCGIILFKFNSSSGDGKSYESKY